MAREGQLVNCRVSRSRAEIPALEPLWNALQVHHSQITPSLAGVTPKRDLDEAWERRRAKYESWLENPASFFVVAEETARPIGYAFVTVGPGYASWATGDKLAELETLSVLPEHRGQGVGAALLDVVWERLEAAQVGDLAITTALTNVDSHRFYERAGFTPGFIIYYARRPADEGATTVAQEG